MNWRLVVAVWVLAVAGGAAVWWLQSQVQTAPERVGPHALISDDALPIDVLERIVIERPDEPTLVLSRDADGWVQTEPFAHPMDPFSVRQVAVAALQLMVSRRVEAADLLEGGLAGLSLDPPEAVVTFEWPDGSRRVALGRLGVAGRAFVQLDDRNAVDVVGQELHDRVLATDPREWRSRRLFPQASVECPRISIRAGDSETVLEFDRRRWRMTAPVETRVDRAALEAFIEGLAGVQAGGFLADQPEDLSVYGLDDPVAVIEVTMPDDSAGIARLLVGDPIGVGGSDRFGLVEGRPTVIRLPGQTLVRLFPPMAALIDPRPSAVRDADVKRIRLRTADADFEIERELDTWRSPDFDGREVPSGAVRDLFERLTVARATQVAVQDFPRELEVGFVTFFGFDRRPLGTVQVARDPQSGMWALESGDGILRLFPEGFALPLEPRDYGLGVLAPGG